MNIKDIEWLVICDQSTEFVMCDLTNLMADCYRCLVTFIEIPDTEFEVDINKHDATNMVNSEA